MTPDSLHRAGMAGLVLAPFLPALYAIAASQALVVTMPGRRRWLRGLLDTGLRDVAPLLPGGATLAAAALGRAFGGPPGGAAQALMAVGLVALGLGGAVSGLRLRRRLIRACREAPGARPGRWRIVLFDLWTLGVTLGALALIVIAAASPMGALD